MLLRLKGWLKRLRGDRRGATSIEYALIAAGISVAIAAAVFLIGEEVAGLYETINERME